MIMYFLLYWNHDLHCFISVSFPLSVLLWFYSIQQTRKWYLWSSFDQVWNLHQHVSEKSYSYKFIQPKAVYYNSIPDCDRSGPIDTIKYPASLGYTLEVCAGIVDKAISLSEIAVEEIYEECGFKIGAEKLEYIIQFRWLLPGQFEKKKTFIKKIVTFSSGVGISGDVQTLYYAEVSEDLRVNSGGGNAEEGEEIELVEMSIQEVEDYLSQPSVSSPGSFLFALQWFLSKKAQQYKWKVKKSCDM